MQKSHPKTCALTVLTAALLLCLPARQVAGWGERAHVMINRAAVKKLPAEMPEFMKKGADLIGYLGVQPDRWKGLAYPLYQVEKANHFLDLEELGEDLSKIKFPESRIQFLGQLRDLGKKVDDVGLIPYQINEYYQRLRGGFLEYRWALRDPKGAQARSPRQFGSLKSIEMTCLYYAGILSHYTGDASQPLHATVFYDGRGPDGKPKRTGVHFRYEIDFVNAHFRSEDAFVSLVRGPQEIRDLLEETKQVLVKSNSLAEKVLAFDETGKLERAAPEAIKMSRQRLADSSQFLLNVWFTAWVASGRDLDDYIKKFQPKD